MAFVLCSASVAGPMAAVYFCTVFRGERGCHVQPQRGSRERRLRQTPGNPKISTTFRELEAAAKHDRIGKAKGLGTAFQTKILQNLAHRQERGRELHMHRAAALLEHTMATLGNSRPELQCLTSRATSGAAASSSATWRSWRRLRQPERSWSRRGRVADPSDRPQAIRGHPALCDGLLWLGRGLSLGHVRPRSSVVDVCRSAGDLAYEGFRTDR